jgi:uncharacterized protein YueI
MRLRGRQEGREEKKKYNGCWRDKVVWEMEKEKHSTDREKSHAIMAQRGGGIYLKLIISLTFF